MRQWILAALLCPVLAWASVPVDGLILIQQPDLTLHGRLNFQDRAQTRDAIVRLASAREYQRFGLARPGFFSDLLVQEDARTPGVIFISTSQVVRAKEFDLVFKTVLYTGVAFTRFHAKIGNDNTVTLTKSVLAIEKNNDASDSFADNDSTVKPTRKPKSNASAEKNERPKPTEQKKEKPARASNTQHLTKRQPTENRQTESTRIPAAQPDAVVQPTSITPVIAVEPASVNNTSFVQPQGTLVLPVQPILPPAAQPPAITTPLPRKALRSLPLWQIWSQCKSTSLT